MRILFVTQVQLDQSHGGARHVVSVARELARLGHEVTLIAPGNEDEKLTSARRVRAPLRLGPGARLELILSTLAVREVVHARPDVAYIRLSASSSFVPLSLTALAIPVVLELNGRILDELRALGRGPLHVEAARRSLGQVVRRARAVVAVENAIGRHATQLGARRVEVIENGADLDIATPGDRLEARRALGLPTDRRLIVFTGTLVPEQRLDLLLEAAAMIPESTLVIAGSGPKSDWLVSTLAARDPKAPVIHLGAVPHAQAIQAIRAADVCVNAREGDLGMKCFEYAAIGRRFVLFAIEGVERLTGLYPALEAAHVVSTPTAGALRDALVRALEAEARLGPLPALAIAAARRTIGWDHTARRISEVLAACASCS